MKKVLILEDKRENIVALTSMIEQMPQNIEKEGQNWLLMQVVLPFQGGEINGHQNIHINTQKI